MLLLFFSIVACCYSHSFCYFCSHQFIFSLLSLSLTRFLCHLLSPLMCLSIVLFWFCFVYLHVHFNIMQSVKFNQNRYVTTPPNVNLLPFQIDSIIYVYDSHRQKLRKCENKSIKFCSPFFFWSYKHTHTHTFSLNKHSERLV